MFITPAFAQTASAGGSLFDMFLPLILVFAIIYFMILRPQQKRQKEHTNMIEALRRGDRVITQGGLIGKVVKVHETELDIEIADGVKVSIVKSMVAVVQSKSEPAKAE
jgi:preprotein translocase subunit YajC